MPQDYPVLDGAGGTIIPNRGIPAAKNRAYTLAGAIQADFVLGDTNNRNKVLAFDLEPNSIYALRAQFVRTMTSGTFTAMITGTNITDVQTYAGVGAATTPGSGLNQTLASNSTTAKAGYNVAGLVVTGNAPATLVFELYSTVAASGTCHAGSHVVLTKAQL